MPKTDFLKTWIVIEDSGNPEDVSGGAFSIYDDGNDKVIIEYDGFGATYPSAQNGTHDTVVDKVDAMFSESNWIELTFDTSGGSTNYDKLDIRVHDPIGGTSLHILCCPDLGEWGAEACPTG